MIEPVRLRHVVSLAGVVREQPLDASASGNNHTHTRMEIGRLSGALVEILVERAPQAFQRKIAALKTDPMWATRGRRIDRTTSQTDGVFYFVDLPPGESGETYTLRVSMPHRATRFGVIETAPVKVEANVPGDRVQVTQVDVVLPVTRIVGKVTDQAGEPLVRANVRLVGTSRVAKSGEDGRYHLSYLLAGRPTIEASLAGYQILQQPVELQAGRTLELDLALQRA